MKNSQKQLKSSVCGKLIKKVRTGYVPPRKLRATERKPLKFGKEVRTQHELGTYPYVDILTGNPRANIFVKNNRKNSARINGLCS